MQFFDAEGNCLSSAELLQDWSQFPLIMQVNEAETYAINFRHENKGTYTEEQVLEMCDAIGLPHKDKYVLANYASKLHLGFKNAKDIQVTDAINMLHNLKFAYVTRNSSNTHNDSKLQTFEALQGQLDAKNARLVELMGIQRQLEKQAATRSKVLGTGIAMTIAAQTAFIIEGTFNSYSWDVIEPMSYQMSLFNMCAAVGWYYAFLYQPNKQDPTEWYAARYIAKKQAAHGYSQEELETLQVEIAQIEELIQRVVG